MFNACTITSSKKKGKPQASPARFCCVLDENHPADLDQHTSRLSQKAVCNAFIISNFPYYKGLIYNLFNKVQLRVPPEDINRSLLLKINNIILKTKSIPFSVWKV